MATEDILEGEPIGANARELLQLVRAQAALLTDVATGGREIKTVEHQYVERRRRIRRGLEDLGLADPFPWRSLWDWYGFWSGNLPSYVSRRGYIIEITASTIDELEARADVPSVSDFGSEEAGWPPIDKKIKEMINELDAAA